LVLIPFCVLGAVDPERVKILKEYITKERPQFEQREALKKGLLGQLDEINSDQNKVRERYQFLTQNHQELVMALENLSMEYGKQRRQEVFEKKRLKLLYRVLYRIKRDGVLRYIVSGHDLNNLSSRIRVLYRTVRTRVLLSKTIEERAKRLSEGEFKLSLAKRELQALIDELHEQEEVLRGMLQRKQRILVSLNQGQSAYLSALREYKEMSKQLTSLFNHLEARRSGSEKPRSVHGMLPLPVQMGRIAKKFGKSVHSKFGTSTYHKGIEIEADEYSPVSAILPGTVEYRGWLKGLGNVIILHHGGGFYTLSAYLHKILKPKGEQVDAGDKIGLVGDTGNNVEPSLYFELRENGKAVDPLKYFSQSAMANLL